MERKKEALQLVILLILSLFLLSSGIDNYIVMLVVISFIVPLEILWGEGLKNMGISREGIVDAIRVQIPFTVLGTLFLFLVFLIRGSASGELSSGYLLYWLLSVPMQEFIFRGYVQGVLRYFFSRVWVASLAAVLFSASHIFADPHYRAVLIPSTLVAGFAWGFAYEHKKNLIGPIISHAVLGTLIFLIF